jgi:hypothetical protein
MKKLIYLLAMMLGLNACSDKATNNIKTQEGDYLPISKGNYWVYDTWELDIFNQEIPNTKTEDSLIVSETGINLYAQDNTNQAIILKFRNGQLIDTIKLKMNNDFVYCNGFFIDSLVRDNPGDYKLLDKDLPYTWNVKIDSLKFNMAFSGFSMPCKLNAIFNSYAEDDEQLNIDGLIKELKVYDYTKSCKYALDYSFDTSKIVQIVTWDTINGIPTEHKKDTMLFFKDTCNINIFLPKHLNIGFIDGIGFGRIIEKPYMVSSTKNREIERIKLINYGVNGRYSVLKRYKIINK